MKQGIGEVKFWGQMNKIFALENNSNSYPFFFHFFFFFSQDENVLSFVWGAFKVRSSYQSYK